MKIEPPKIDPRKLSDFEKMLRRFVPHYTPEWKVGQPLNAVSGPGDERDPGVAVMKIFSHIIEAVIHRFNQVPRKNFIAFLDMLGIKLLPAQSAWVPLTFKLAKGTNKEVLIPARTQAAADKTNEHEELPFETEENLWATPSQVIKVISIDPIKDAIYLPPPGFLDEEREKQNQIAYTMSSTPRSGAKEFQLDHVTGLKEGDFLKINRADNTMHKEGSSLCNHDRTSPDAESSSEYVIIAGISGTIIEITDGLSASYPAGTPVEKVTKFNLFEGKNMQEHSLYLGHKDLLNIKSKGRITLEVALAPGTETGNSRLNLVWEYWGEDKENETEGWIRLQVEEDETNGFTKGGEISLFKFVEGEIKEQKIGDVFKKALKRIEDKTIEEKKSRWIRCRLRDNLAAGTGLKLPMFDTILLKTEPSKEIPPDAGFFNDIPLDWTRGNIKAKVVEITDNVLLASSSTAATNDTATNGININVDSVEGFEIGDKVSILRKKEIIADATIVDIYIKYKRIKLTDFIIYNNKQMVKDDVIQANKLYPFGKQARLYDTFYIGSKEAFSKKDAKITLLFSLARLKTFTDNEAPTPPIDPKLSWEYWNGHGWQAITVKDNTNRLLELGSGKNIEFDCPKDIEETDVNGQKNYWIRAKLVGGDYGREEYIIEDISPSELSASAAGVNKQFKTTVVQKYNLPIIYDLKINYSFDTMIKLQYCLTYNNLAFQDTTLHARTPGQFFPPFIPLEEIRRSMYLGFDMRLSGGPIRIFFAAKELPFTVEKKPKLEWTYSAKTDWKVLSYLDDTEGLIMADILEFIGPEDHSGQSWFGSTLYWMKGSLTEGEYEEFPLLDGIYPNTTWTIQAATIRDEILGSGDGRSNQSFPFQKFPVLEGEEIRVRETLSEEERQNLITSLGDDAIKEVKDEKGNVTETWVLWKEAPDFFDSGEKDRHYTLDRALGQIQFGDGIKGMIPPSGDNNIKAFSYQAGGGKQGNVKAGEIKTLKSAVPGVDKVSNPVLSDGGADTATVDQMLKIGPAMISHRNRAVTAEDFEWLAKQASREVVKVKCLSNTNNKRQRDAGWVTVIIVPDSQENKPYPSLGLRRKVRKYLETCSANTLMSPKLTHIDVDGPSYVEVGVSVDVFVASIDLASTVERQVRITLNNFFHPLTGGPEGNGWDFGRDVLVSDIYALIEGIKDVDHVENLQFTYNGITDKDTVKVEQNSLVASGDHTINLRLKNV